MQMRRLWNGVADGFHPSGKARRACAEADLKLKGGDCGNRTDGDSSDAINPEGCA
ncbi:MAG: hypothetical protein LBU32_16525 [Clostridiales bacterium]|nr:hypothetical protein [Clostridiales bacterium]